MRILVTGAGGAAAISVWKSLNQKHELHMADIDPNAAGIYLVPPAQRLLIPRGDLPGFAETLLALCKERHIDILIATVDCELVPLAKMLAQFELANIHVPLCPFSVLECCYDKHALLTHCLNTAKDKRFIPEFVLLTEESSHSLKTFPRFAKPRFGAGSNGVKLIKEPKDLLSLPHNGSYLVQEYLPGKEYSVDAYLDSKGRPIAAVPRLRMKVDSGVAVTARTEHLPELSRMAIEVAQLVGVRYVANIQFKEASNGQFKLLEINPRFSGALPLTTAAGVDIPKLLVQDVLGNDLPQGLMPFKELMVVRYWTEHFFAPKEWDQVCQNLQRG